MADKQTSDRNSNRGGPTCGIAGGPVPERELGRGVAQMPPLFLRKDIGWERAWQTGPVSGRVLMIVAQRVRKGQRQNEAIRFTMGSGEARVFW